MIDKKLCDKLIDYFENSKTKFKGTTGTDELYDPKYKECWDKFGDNVEYQLRTHLEKNDIEIIYLGNQRNFFHLYR